MKYLDEFKDKKLAQKVIAKINKLSAGRSGTETLVSGAAGRPVNLMEVCGTHTVAIYKNGLKDLLPKNINLLSGPGCPVCVTADQDIDKAIALAKQKDVIITTFGDMMKVPGSITSLQKEKTNGRDIRVVYSTLDALQIARKNPKKKIIFLAVGFETTSPTIASAIQTAKKEKLKNFYILPSHKLIPPAMEALLNSKDVKIDGFICPGHVSTIIGANAYQAIAKNYKIPCVVAGFEPLDILEAIYLLLKNISNGHAQVQNEYKRVVKNEGNTKAQNILEEVFTVSAVEWRGLGVIPGSGLKLKKEYQEFDAENHFQIKIPETKKNPACICGEILRGAKDPYQCKLFAKICSPDNPIGPCMVSSEGTCAAFYKYQRTKA